MRGVARALCPGKVPVCLHVVGGGGVLKGDMVVGSSLVTESESLCGANRVWGGEGRGGHQGLSG